MRVSAQNAMSHAPRVRDPTSSRVVPDSDFDSGSSFSRYSVAAPNTGPQKRTDLERFSGLWHARKTATDENSLASNVARLVACQKLHCVRNILGSPESS